ncbi:MAG: putative transporter permease protein [Jatrophihabitans sp.]|nr:putative transporter permease protein [Jatrophihabitans sp.]
MLRRAVVSLAPPIIFGVAVILLWQLFVTARHIKSFVLPAPSAIWTAFRTDHSRILTAAEHTGLNALVGLVVGTLLAVLVAAFAARLKIADAMVTPLIAALAAMPIVALAPLLNDMYSSTSTLPRRIVVAISAFVPVFMNVLRGLKRLSPVHAELMASYAASGTAVLRTIRIPGALPYFFTGLRIAASLSVIAAVVTEYFGGLQDGLGSRITSAVSATNYPGAWASVLGAVLLGLLFYVVAVVTERLAMSRRVDASQ